MAAYAAAVSLMHILDQIKNHPSPPISPDKQQFDSLTEVVTFLHEFLESYVSPFTNSEEADPLEMRIAEAIYAAEDVIESYIVDNIHPAAASTSAQDDDDDEQFCCFNFCEGLRKVIEAMGLIKKEAMEMVKEKAEVDDDDVAMESYMVESVQLAAAATHHEDEQIRYINFYVGLQNVIESMDLIKEEAIEMETDRDKEKGRLLEAEVQRIVSKSSSIESKSKMVGFDGVRRQLLDRLVGGDSNRQIIPIVGMGGIGKTTLTRDVFADQLIKENFHIRVWATISQDCNIEQTLREVLTQAIGGNSGGEKSVDKLGDELYQYLFGRKYLVVLDDMWGIEAWDKIRHFFPNHERNGSRIIVTTRMSNLADLLSSSSNSLYVSFLNKVDSWTLFSKTVFGIGSEGCVLELREIGEKIVEKCKGLPLSIAVIGGLLAKSEHTQEYWEYVENNLNSIVNSENEEYCSRLLKLSYNHLPVYLKPCFLYMGVFDEDRKISVSVLIRLWISEGFLKPGKNKSMRTIAKECLKELVERNLIILVRKLGRRGNRKYLKIHDLLRDLSLKEAEKQKFYYVLRQCSPHCIDSQRRIVIPRNASEVRVRNALESPMPRVRSYLCHNLRVRQLPYSELLRTLNVFDLGPSPYRCHSLKQVLRFVNSRHLVFEVRAENSQMIPSCIKMLWNLRTLIVDTLPLTAPVEFWKMHQLEHVEFTYFSGSLCPPAPAISGEDDMVIMKNLHTLKGVIDFDLNEDTVKRIPNIKKLGIIYETERVNCLSHLGCLRQLENLRLLDACHEYMQGIKFPETLKKLNLMAPYVPNLKLGDMMLQEIGSLPLLQKLKLENVVFRSPTWETAEGHFPSLLSLELKWCFLKEWTVSDSFPLLRDLSLLMVRELEEIPLEIGERGTLRSVSLYDCLESVVKSATKILEEEEELNGKQSNLHVRVDCRNKSDAEALQGLSASPNFHVLVDKFFSEPPKLLRTLSWNL